jgi:hypothetical protein
MSTQLTYEDRIELKRRIDQARRETLPTVIRQDRNPYVRAADGIPEIALWLAIQDHRERELAEDSAADPIEPVGQAIGDVRELRARVDTEAAGRPPILQAAA